MFTKTLVILASISAAFAVPFITQPVASTTFQAGTPATIKWEDSGKTPSLESFGPCAISIYAGNAMQQTRLQQLSSSIDVSKVTELSFTPDPTIGPNSSQYFIRIESLSLKDPTQPQYPALAFSAKFTLSGMRGTFTPAVQSQIDGQSTAPLASPTTTVIVKTSPSPTVTSGFSTSKIPSSTAIRAPSATASSSAAHSVVFHGSWIGFLLSTFFGVTML